MSSLSSFTLKDLTVSGLIAALVAICAGGTLANDLIFSAMGTPGNFPPIALLIAGCVACAALWFLLRLACEQPKAVFAIAVILLGIAIWNGAALRLIISSGFSGFYQADSAGFSSRGLGTRKTAPMASGLGAFYYWTHAQPSYLPRTRAYA